MKKYNIKVNGNAYEVEVEEILGGATAAQIVTAPAAAAPVAAAAPTPAAPAPTPAAAAPAAAASAPAATPVAPASAAAPAGAKVIESPMPGTIMKVTVNVGDEVKRGGVVLILEAMKMENDIVSPFDGKVAAIHVSQGATVNSGDLLVSII